MRVANAFSSDRVVLFTATMAQCMYYYSIRRSAIQKLILHACTYITRMDSWLTMETVSRMDAGPYEDLESHPITEF